MRRLLASAFRALQRVLSNSAQAVRRFSEWLTSPRGQQTIYTFVMAIYTYDELITRFVETYNDIFAKEYSWPPP